MEPNRVLAALADLAPVGGDRILDVTRGGQPLIWLADADRAPRRREIDRLAALDALHRDERVLRRGWGFVIGRQEIDGVLRKVRVPLLSQPVRLERSLGGYRLVAAGDLELTPLVADRARAAAMEAAPGLGAGGWLSATGTRAWLRSAAEAAGLRVDRVHPFHPRPALPAEGSTLLVAAGLFVVRDVFGTALGDSLRSWAGRSGLRATALAALYAPVSPPNEPNEPNEPDEPDEAARWDDADEPLSPLPLTEAQTQVLRRARTAAVTVVSGPPGNGKSHAVIAAALDVVHGGGSVLVATQSPHAADVLADLVARYPGPAPVLFGDAERRAALATALAAGAETSAGQRDLRADRAAVEAAHQAVRRLRAAIAAALAVEEQAAGLSRWQALLPRLGTDVPGAFDDDADLDRVSTLLRRAETGTGGWWARRRAAAARRRAWRLLRAADGVPMETVTDAIAAAVARCSAARLAATGGTDLAPMWAALHDAEDVLARTVGDAMRRAAGSAERCTAQGRRGAAALAAALRAGRNRRREMLAALDGPPLVRALPLWIGTVADVEDLLPPVPGLFDLVVLDEASHVDQVRAAAVLARAKRALVVGDPRQLRFVSFVGDAELAGVLARHQVDDRLDVRRVSAFDLAAGAAPVVWLDEHHRCAPQLIGFSADRFYGGRIAVATRHPRTEAADVIDVLRVTGAVVDAGVNAAEVDAVVAAVRRLAEAGRTGIAVVTPFRAQADALEAALLDAFEVGLIERLRLRVGTVHAFQGSEADTVVASLGVVPADSAGRRRFLADPHLFNVLITRARQRMIVVTSLERDDGLVGEYLAYADDPAQLTAAPGPALDDWVLALRDELHRLGVPARPGYSVGSWRVDLCVGPAAVAVGVLCAVHPDGVAAHLARQRALRRAGWRLSDAFASSWAGDPRRAALEIAAELRTDLAAPVSR